MFPAGRVAVFVDTRTLRKEGWRVLRIWEHELAPKNEQRLIRRLAAMSLTEDDSPRSPATT